MNLAELESKLREHGQNVKNSMTLQIDTERNDSDMIKNGRKMKKTVLAVIAAAVCVLGGTVFAAYKVYNYLSAEQAADMLGDKTLAERFKDGDSEISSETVSDGDYKATVLGITSGENISDLAEGEDIKDKTYAVVAIEKTDGSDMTYDDDLLVTPFVEGLKPWQFNIFTIGGGGASGKIIDGVLYRIVEFGSVECFADRHIYLAVMSGGFNCREAYNYDESTGLITSRDYYDGTNILFDMPIDKSKADPKKAQKYIDEIEKEWGEAISEDEEKTKEDFDVKVEKTDGETAVIIEDK